MQRFRKKPVFVEAVRWWRNGDHPYDFSDRDNGIGAFQREGLLVRFYNPATGDEHRLCKHCSASMYAHGWISTLEGGHIVCPGDWIIRGVEGEFYPCKPDIFDKTYDRVEG